MRGRKRDGRGVVGVDVEVCGVTGGGGVGVSVGVGSWRAALGGGALGTAGEAGMCVVMIAAAVVCDAAISTVLDSVAKVICVGSATPRLTHGRTVYRNDGASTSPSSAQTWDG